MAPLSRPLLIRPARQLLLERDTNLNFQGGHHGTALQAVHLGGHKEGVLLPLERGADANAQGGQFGNALQVVSAWWVRWRCCGLRQGLIMALDSGPLLAGNVRKLCSSSWRIVNVEKRVMVSIDLSTHYSVVCGSRNFHGNLMVHELNDCCSEQTECLKGADSIEDVVHEMLDTSDSGSAALGKSSNPDVPRH